MKILQISPHFKPNIGGVETHLDDLVSGLILKKHQVFVLSYIPLQTKVSFKVFEKSKNLKVFRIPWISGLFYKFINKPILEFLYLFPGIFLIAPFVILYEKPNVIHAHGLIAGVVSVFWGKVFNIRTVISTHNIYNFPKSGLYLNLMKMVFNNTDHILCLSSQSADEIKKIVDTKNINYKNKVGVFTSWVNLKIFHSLNKIESKKKLGWEKQFVVLFVGRLVPEKGVMELLEAGKLFKKGLSLKIAGSGLLEHQVGKYYIGKVSQNDLPTYYSAADVVILPSTHDEGFGRVVVESLACGTPVIGSKRGAIPEVMDETVGKLIDVTPVNIKKSVEYFYDNPKKLKNLSKNARKFVEKRYSNKNLESILLAYSNERYPSKE